MHIRTSGLQGKEARDVASELLTILHAMEEKGFIISTTYLEHKVSASRQHMVANDDDNKRWSLATLSKERLAHYKLKLAKAKLLSEILESC